MIMTTRLAGLLALLVPLCVPQIPAPVANYQGWESIGTSVDVLVIDNISPVTYSAWIAGPWKSNTAYDCRVAPCSQINQAPAGLSVSVTRETSHCWSVGGSFSVDVKTSLVTRLILELGVTAEVNGNFQHCENRVDGITGTVPVNQCFHNSGRFRHRNAMVTGKRTYAANQTVWANYPKDYPGPDPLYMTTDCGRRTIGGNADKLNEEVFQIAPPRPECGGQEPPDPQFDLKFMEPCCPNIAGCTDTQTSCCGCTGNS